MEKAKKERKQKLSFRFVLTRRVIENSKKNSEKIQKIKKFHYGFISSQNRTEKAEKEKTRTIVSFRPYPTRNRKLQKNIAKKFKKLKNSFSASFQAKIG